MRKFLSIILSVVILATGFVPVLAAEDDGVLVNFDFTKMTEVPANASGSSQRGTSDSAVVIGEDNGVNVLQWKRTIKTNLEQTYMDIPLETPITKADFPIEIEYSAKLDALTSNFLGPFSLRGTNAAGTTITSLYGPTKQGSYVDFELRIMSTKDQSAYYGIDASTVADIFYNNSPLASDKYYIHNFVIEADGTYTYKIKEDTEDAQWQDVYADHTLWVSAADYDVHNVWRNRGIMPDEITSLFTGATYYNAGRYPVSTEQAAIDGAKEQVDSFKYLMITKRTLELNGTSLPEGENPQFADKNIKLYFNSHINADTLYDGIKLYKDGVEVPTNEYSLSVETYEPSEVNLVLNSYPAFNANYEIRVNSNLNKDKTGYAKAADDYSKTVAFCNGEQGTGLELVSSTPVDSAAHSVKKITLDFNSPIDLASAKANIVAYKGEELLVCDEDYTVALDTNDDTIVYLTLDSFPEYSQETQKVWYKVVVGKDLNKGTTVPQIFPDTYTEKTISFYNPANLVYFDFTSMTEVPANTTTGSAANTSISTATIGEDNGVNVLQWKRIIKGYLELANMNIPLETPITKADFPIEIEYSAKLDKLRSAPRGPFALKGTNAAGAVVNTLYGPTKQGSYVTDELRTMSTKDQSTHYVLGNGTETDILYNGAPLDSSKYYIHNFVIEADGTYTYKIKEDTESGTWQDIYPDKKHWVSASDWDPENVWRNRGILPDTITSLWSEATYYNAGTAPVSAEQAAIDNATEQVDSFKYLRISKRALELDGTNLPEGENPAYGEKNIKLYFNSYINADTLYDGIKLYKDGVEVPTNEYSLSVETYEPSEVNLVLNDYPAFGSNYEIRVGDDLNKNKQGYAESTAGYSAISKFYGQQGTGLELVSSTPVDGAVYSQKKITLNFNNVIDLASAKANIKAYKGEELLVCDTDYTVALDASDATKVYITLSSLPEYSEGTDKVWYKIVVGKDLNKGTAVPQIFPDTYTEQTISFYNIENFVYYDFSTMAAAPAHTTGAVNNAGTSELVIGEDNGVNVLQWKRHINVHGQLVNVEIPLTTPITKANFPIEIEYSAKLNKTTSAPRGPFALKGTNAAGAVVNTLYGPTNQGSYTNYELRIMSSKDGSTNYQFGDNTNTDILYNGEPIDKTKYYVHNFVIDADGSYTYKIKEDTEGAQWQEVYPEHTLWVTAKDWDWAAVQANRGILPETITSLWSEATYYNENAGKVSAEQAAIDMASEMTDYFKYLKISNHTLELGETDLPEGENPVFAEKNIKLDFNSPISADTLYNGIKLYKDDVEVSTNEYTLSVDSADTTVVNLVLNEYPAFGSNYEIRINSELNKNKEDYYESAPGYSAVVRFHSEQGTGLSLVATTLVDGAAYFQNKITLDFNNVIDLASAKANIKIYKEEKLLDSDTDYTVALDANDGTIVYVTLNSALEESGMLEKIWYKVVVGADLNKNTTMPEAFPNDYTEKAISFYNPTSYIGYDFSEMTNPPTHTTGVKGTAGSSSELVVGEDNGENVLQWKRNIKAHAEQVNLEIPLETPITKADFPIEIEYSAKLDGLTSAPRGPFALKGTDAAGNEVNTLYGPTSQGSYVDYELRVMSEKGDKSKCYTFAEITTDIFYNGKGLDSSKYYVHNFVINADGSYTYKIKEDTEGAEWQDVYPDYTLWVTSKDWDYTAIKNNAGVLPDTITSLWSESTYFNGGGNVTEAQNADMLKEKIDYFKYVKIKTSKQVEQKISATSIADDAEVSGRVVVNAEVKSNIAINDAQCIIAMKTSDGKLIDAELCNITAKADVAVPVNVNLDGKVDGYVIEAFLLDAEQRPYIYKTLLQ